MAAYSSRIEARPRAAWQDRWLTRERLAPVVAGLAFLIVWEIYVRAALPDFVARPSGIVAAIPATMSTPDFWRDVFVTLVSILQGVAIGSAAGILVGVAMGRVREINWFLSTYIRALYALPLIALVPIVILWVGYQPAARLVIVVISVFLPVAVTTADGTRTYLGEILPADRLAEAGPPAAPSVAPGMA